MLKGEGWNGGAEKVPGGDFIFTLTDPAGAPLGIVGKRGA
jgi:hypothetical protein